MIMRMARNSFPVNGGMLTLVAARFALAACSLGRLTPTTRLNYCVNSLPSLAVQDRKSDIP